MTARITTLITVPDSTLGRASFVAAANDMGRAMTPWAGEANALADEVNQNAGQAAQDAANAHADALSAQQAATAAAPSWQSGGTYVQNAVAWDTDGGLYRAKAAHTGVTTHPANDPAHWELLVVSAAAYAAALAQIDALRDVPPVAKAGALAPSDRGRNVQATGDLSIPAYSSGGLDAGAAMQISNNTNTTRGLTPATGVTLVLAGTGPVSSVVLGPYAKAALSCEQRDKWMIAGSNVSS